MDDVIFPEVEKHNANKVHLLKNAIHTYFI